jgi:glycosyltransferase involved in cell wall biosynthesis
MRILILGSKEYPMGSNKGDDPIPSGGMETYVDDLAEELSKNCNLLIVTRRFRGTKKCEHVGNIEVLRVPYFKGKYLRNPTFNFLSFMASLKPMRKVDAIYPQGLIGSFFSYLLSRIYGKPVAARPAGTACDQYRFPLNKILFMLTRTVYRKCDCVVFHSEGERSNFIRELGFIPQKSEVILTGIPVEKFSRRIKSTKHAFGIPENSIVVGFIGRFVEVKGIEYLVRAAALLEDKDVRFMLVGDGPQKVQIQSLLKSLGLESRFIFTGFTRDIPEALAAMDIFVISSLSEGLPTSLLEAMAAGKACVVTDIGLPVKDGETGIVVRPKDPESLAHALESLIKNQGLRKRLGRSGQRFVLENCTQEKSAKKHFEMFARLLRGG